jgi:cytochrome c biogenesis protein CcmG, thiol:disulfide interchange protein DsbE
MGMKRPLLLVPLLAFLAVLGVVATGLWKPADRTVRSRLVGQPLPEVALPPMLADRPAPGPGFRAGRVRLVNVFASWCVPCIAEAPQLMRLKAMGVPIDGVAVRDSPVAIRQFLGRYGDPYATVGDDRQGRVQLALGSSGVPETFVVAGDGTILHQHIGDIREDQVAELAAMAGVGAGAR